MKQTLDIGKPSAEPTEHALTREKSRKPISHAGKEGPHDFLAELDQMTSDERISASRYTMKRWEYWIYAAHFPQEVPTVNGELELIAATLE